MILRLLDRGIERNSNSEEKLESESFGRSGTRTLWDALGRFRTLWGALGHGGDALETVWDAPALGSILGTIWLEAK